MDAFLKDLGLLNIDKPEIIAKATEHIDIMEQYVKKIIENGYTYNTDDTIYFDTSKLPDYGILSKKKVEEQKAGARVDFDDKKKNISDFALWIKAPQNHIMKWDSFFGKCYPGWHLECSAMSYKYLGEHFDIHTGGVDHIPIHHENEIAQCKGFCGKTPANFWMHVNFLTVNDGKMSKSLNNLYTLDDLKDKGYDPLVYRMFNFSSQYRNKINFTWEALESSKKALIKLKEAFKKHEEGNAIIDNEILVDCERKFHEAINDDLNMPLAMSYVWEIAKYPEKSKQIANLLLKFDTVLGLKIHEKIEQEEQEIPEEVIKLLEERNKAKMNKDWSKADNLRDIIKEKGYNIKDTRRRCNNRKNLMYFERNERKLTEENNEKIGFFKRILLGVKDFEAYVLFAGEKTSKAIGYLLKFMIIFAVITSLVFTYKFSNSMKKAKEYFINDIPELSYSNGTLDIQSKDAIVNENIDEIIQIIIIDTNADNEQENKYKERMLNYDSGLVFLKDKVVLRNSMMNESIEYKYSEITTAYNLTDFNKDQAIQYINGLDTNVIYIVFFITIFIYMYVIYLVSTLLDTLLLAILAFVISRAIRIKLMFKACFNMAIYALTLPIILNCIYIIVNNLTGFTVQYFNWMYTTISYIYIIIAILIIKTDTINKQMELIKVIKEQEKVRDEMQQKEQKEEKEETKDEDKSNKENEDKNQKKKKDKEDNMPDEPEGSNA